MAMGEALDSRSAARTRGPCARAHPVGGGCLMSRMRWVRPPPGAHAEIVEVSTTTRATVHPLLWVAMALWRTRMALECQIRLGLRRWTDEAAGL